MVSSVAAFLIAMFVAAILTPIVRAEALRRGVVDPIATRKVHTAPTPRLGGIVIVVGFYIAVALVLLVHTSLAQLLAIDATGLVGTLIAGAAIALLGVFDDLRGAGAGVKFTVQFAIAVALFAVGFRIERLAIPIYGVLPLGWASLPVTTIWIVGVTNAINLIDGLDGLAAGITLIALSAVFAIAAMRGAPLMLLFSAALAGSVIGFFFYNFNPATIFMGDTGSMFLGLMLATSSIRASQKSSTAVAMFVPIALLLLPLVDTALALIRRSLRRQRLFDGDREHIHHRLIRRGLSQRQAIGVMYVASALAGTSALLWYLGDRHKMEASLALSGAIVICVAAYRIPQPVTAKTELPSHSHARVTASDVTSAAAFSVSLRDPTHSAD